MKKRIIIGLTIFIFIIIIILSIKYINSVKYKLSKKGYSKEDVRELIKFNMHISKILDMEYNPKILDLFRERYYLDKNFLDYVSYLNNNDVTISDVVAIVNVKAHNPWYSIEFTSDISKVNSVLVNKFHKLPKDYISDDIVPIKNWYAYEKNNIKKEVYEQFILMHDAAKIEDLSLIINSSYRSYDDQENIYNEFIKKHGTNGSLLASKPGHSEHQTGLALDIITKGITGEEFDTTPEFNWLKNNAHKYGFILRYPKGKEYLTGYEYESWHYRYLGVDLASKVYESSLTYDEYYAYYLD